MKVLLFNGSPHKNGSTNECLEILKDFFEKVDVQADIVHIGSEAVSGCRACKKCHKEIDGKCMIDDIVNEVLDKVANYDGFIFASPVHYASACGEIASFMDRLFYRSGVLFAHKPASAVVVCRRGGGTTAFDRINKYFQITNMPIVSSSYWNIIHGSNADDIRKDLEGVQILNNLANNMAWLLKCIDIAKKEGIEYPEIVKGATTNFIR